MAFDGDHRRQHSLTDGIPQEGAGTWVAGPAGEDRYLMATPPSWFAWVSPA